MMWGTCFQCSTISFKSCWPFNIVLREPLGHDVGHLLPVLDDLLQILLALHHMHVNNPDISYSSIFLELISEHSTALLSITWKIKVLHHEGYVSVPSLVQAQHT